MSEHFQNQIDDINRKLDLIIGKLGLDEAPARHEKDITPLTEKPAADLDIQDKIELKKFTASEDFTYLLKQLIKNADNLSYLLQQLDSGKTFLEDFSPVFKQIYLDSLDKLDELDRKGYFDFLRELRSIIDNIVISFTVEDVRNLSNNIVTILNTVKNLTQPDILNALNNAMGIFQNVDLKSADENISSFKILRELNKPETKRGLNILINFLKNLGETTRDSQ